VFNNTRDSVLLAAVMHGTSNTWGGYIDVYRGHFGGILAFGAVSVMIIIIIVLVFGTTDLSRTCRRNVLELKGDQPDETQLLNEEITQQATPRQGFSGQDVGSPLLVGYFFRNLMVIIVHGMAGIFLLVSILALSQIWREVKRFCCRIRRRRTNIV
jgi:hypothetical protein